VKTLPGHKAEVVAVAYNAAGQLFSASIDGAVLQWDVDAAAPARTFGPHEGGVSTLALSHDGKVLAVADNFHARFVKYGPGKYLVDGRRPGTVTLWSSDDGRKLGTLTGHSSAIVSLSFRADGLLATASWDGTVRLWNSATRSLVASVPKQNHKLHGVAFSNDGKTLAVGCDDRTVQLWDVGSVPRWLFQRAVLKGHNRETTCLAFGKDDQYLVSGSGAPTSTWFVKGGEVLVWDASN
jgi:WD40 repeat protein